MTTFEDLGLTPELLKAIDECGYTKPTPIQAQAIPSVLMARDIVGLAQTGTGKTASFTLPMIDILAGGRAKARMPRSLILAPTRELAAQVADNFEMYGKYHKLSKALLVGGTSMGDQIKILERGVDVLIATPGRLLDLFDRGQILLNDIKVLVIDEADRMLDMGFIPDIERIVSLLSPMRQTLLFSATMAPEIKKLTQKFLSNPKEVSVAPPASPAETVEQFIVWADKRDKNKIIDEIIQSEDVKNAFVFCNRKKDIAGLASWLQNHNYAAAGLHGDMAQSQRTLTLERFKDGEISLLICSDVAARGLDVQGLSHVFNFDVPMNADDYVHRIGRTGRAGMKGRAWMLATKEEVKYVDAIENRIKKPIPVEEIDGFRKPSVGSRPSSSEQKSSHQGKSSPKGKNIPDKKSENKKPDHRKSDHNKSDHRKSDYKKQGDKKPHQGKSHQDDGRADVSGFGNDVPDFFANK